MISSEPNSVLFSCLHPSLFTIVLFIIVFIVLCGYLRYSKSISGPLTKDILLLIIPSNLPGETCLSPWNRHAPPGSEREKELLQKTCAVSVYPYIILQKSQWRARVKFQVWGWGYCIKMRQKNLLGELFS